MKNLKHKAFLLILLFVGASGFAQVNVDILVVASGGSGGAHQGGATAGSGGGGGGGVVYLQNTSLSNGSYTVTVSGTTVGKNNGSSTCNGVGNNGGNSSITITNGLSITAYGGGGGGGCNTANGNNGGSSGGGHCNGSGGTPSKGVCSNNNGGTLNYYGNSGGIGGSCTTPTIGGGGGGAGGAGSQANGGAGISISISGISHVFGSGGGGNASTGGIGGTNAGNGTSGTATTNSTNNAVNNFGGGGGGSSCGNCTSGSGGSGVVIIRYPSNSPLATGGTITSYVANGSNGTNGVTYQVHTFISSGTFVYTGIISTQPSSATQNVCLNGTPNNLSVSATGSFQTYQWYSNTTPSNSGGTLISGETNSSYTPPTSSTGTRYYYCAVSSVNSGITTNQTSNVSGAVIVSNPFIPGSIIGANSVSSGTNSTTLTLNGSIGTIQWQESTDDIAFTNISSQTSATYTASNLSTTRYFRAQVSVTGCLQTPTASVAVVVQPATIALSTSLNIGGTNTSSTPITIVNNTATVVDPNLTVSATGAIRGFSVTISQNYATGDILDFTGTLPSGVTASSFNTQSRSLVFNGSANASEWQALLRTVRLRSTNAACTPERRVVTFSVSSLYYNYFNGHFYEYVPTGRVWTDAKSFAASKTFFGMQGYLAVISTAEENAYISTLIGQNSWLGATDNFEEINQAVGYRKYTNQSAAEGNYHWVTGPEKGKPFSQSGVYKRWQSGEPNNFNTGFYDKITKSVGEHYLHIYSDRKTWNDFPNDRRLGSIIEYGGMPNDAPLGTISFDVNIVIQGLAGGSISGGRDTVCSTTTTLTLNLSGHTGSVSKWQYSNDNFFTDINDIANTTTQLVQTNLSETRFFRAIVVNGSCQLATPSRFRAVIPPSKGVISTLNNEICPGGDIVLQASDFSGSISKWQITSGDINSINPPTTDITSTNAKLTHTIVSAGNYHIRAVYSYCSQSTYSEWYPITVVSTSTPIGGSVSTAAHCGSSNTGTLQLSGASGSSFQWQKSTDGGNNWSNESSTSTSLTYHNIAQNTLFRVIVSAGNCGATTSSIGEVQIYGTSKSLWTGNQNTVWNNPNNWCSNVVGGNGKHVVISSEALNDAALVGDLHLASLNFNASGRKVILGSHHLRTDLLFGTDSINFVQTNSTGTLKRSIAHTDSFLFGVGNTSYNPVQIINKTGSSDEFSVSVFNGVYEKGRKGQGRALLNERRVDRTWEISKANPTSNSGDGVDFQFEWEVSHRVNLNTNVTRLSHFSTSLDAWEFASNSATERGSYFLKVKGYKGAFSPFAIGDEEEILPISLGEFNVEQEGNTGVLRWVTLSENNTEKTEILKSSDGIEWEKIGEVEAAGNSYSTREYIYIDHALGTVNYYQLQFIDKDGAKEKSVVRMLVKQEPQKAWQVSVYPNPSFGEIYVETAKPCSYEIMNVEGKSIQKGEIKDNKKIEGLGRGMYFIKCTAPNSQETWTKFIVQ